MSPTCSLRYREHKVGEIVPFEVVRSDQTVTIDVTLGSDASRQ